MIRTVWGKIKNKASLNACLLGGLLLLIGMFACHPLLMRGNEMALLQRLFDGYVEEQQAYPSVMSRKWELAVDATTSVDAIYDRMAQYRDKWMEYVSLPMVEEQRMFRFTLGMAGAVVAKSSVTMSLWGGRELPEHAVLVDGEAPGTATVREEDGVRWYPCYVSLATAEATRTSVGRKLQYIQARDEEKNNLHLYVAGILAEKEANDPYWMERYLTKTDMAWVTDAVFEEIYHTYTTQNSVVCYERVLPDYTKITPDNAADIRYALEQFYAADAAFQTPLKGLLTTEKREARSVQMLLLALELPCIILMLLFVMMVLSRILTAEEAEMAVWRSRGFRRRQVVRMYVLQFVAIGLPAYGGGMALGYGLCRLAARTDSFLSFGGVDNGAYIMTGTAALYGLLGWALATLLVIPMAWRASRQTLADRKQINRFRPKRPLTETLFVDVLLVVVSIYLLRNFENQKAQMVAGALRGEGLDPMVFLTPSLFMLGAGLLVLRLTRYVVYGIERLGRAWLGAAAYAACLQTKRTYGAARTLGVFLVMTIAGGLFDASLAASVNQAQAERTAYAMGCDMRTTESWKKTLHAVDGGWQWMYNEPDAGRYDDPAVSAVAESRTRVLTDRRSYAQYKREQVDHCLFMGIITDEFGRTAQLQDGINDEHWYNALNALAAEPEGLIISENAATKLGVTVGDTITYARYAGEKELQATMLQGMVVAVVKGFPGYEPYVYEENEEGITQETEQFLLVGNYAAAVQNTALQPYEMWFRLRPGCTEEQLTEALDAAQVKVATSRRMTEAAAKHRNASVLQVMNGIFTIRFLLCGCITVAGFLIYWIVSIRSRELLFGVYRAMGMHMSEVGGLLLLEVFFGSLVPAFAALGIGVLAAIYFTDIAAYVCLPEKSCIALPMGMGTDRLQAFGIGILLMGLLCYIILRHVIRRMTIARALKLGED